MALMNLARPRENQSLRCMSSCATGTLGTALSHTSEATAPASTSSVGTVPSTPIPACMRQANAAYSATISAQCRYSGRSARRGWRKRRTEWSGRETASSPASTKNVPTPAHIHQPPSTKPITPASTTSEHK